MAGFECSLCGDSHEEDPTDFGCRVPDVVWELSDEDRERFAEFDTDFCRFDGRFFIRCILLIPMAERDESFGWGVWCEVEEKDFLRYEELFDQDGTNEPPIQGTIANLIPGDESSLDEPITIQLSTSDQRPIVTFPDSSEIASAREQRSGMSNLRYHEILVELGHL